MALETTRSGKLDNTYQFVYHMDNRKPYGASEALSEVNILFCIPSRLLACLLARSLARDATRQHSEFESNGKKQLLPAFVVDCAG